MKIISIGDHCAIPIILRSLGLRKEAFPFDWNDHVDGYLNTNILYNISLIEKLNDNNARQIATEYIGDAFSNKIRMMNSETGIAFPHEPKHNNINDFIDKYERRFSRLYNNLSSVNYFVLLTRNYYIEEEEFIKIINVLQKNKENKIIFISGKNHEFLSKYNVIFKHSTYEGPFYDYDPIFRNKVNEYIKYLFNIV